MNELLVNRILVFADGCFDWKQHDFGERSPPFRRHFIEMVLGSVDTREAYVFVWLTRKYVIKSAEWPFILSKVYCEIDIAQWSGNITKLTTNRQEITQYC